MDNAPDLYTYDKALRAEYPLLCGVDEAGRGPLCGPVAAAAVVLDPANMIEGLNDSKKLTEAKREALFPLIRERALAYKVILVPPGEIDRVNILNATLWGMQRAVEGLATVPGLVLVDGNKTPHLTMPCRAVTKGDARSASIAAASILAKVTRDHYMLRLAEQYPGYGLEKHKGYPTKEHYECLRTRGFEGDALQIYRRSFLKKSGLLP